MTNPKRYQVFLSSTYVDLIEERSELMQALLELNCMPAGMELFPAANDEQWTWIKRVIDESDYYILVLAARYGTVSDRTALSYTEMEYRYAIETGKPTIAFLHDSPRSLPVEKTDDDPTKAAKLRAFRGYVETKLCKQWNGSGDLAAKVSRSITQLMNRYPAVGWIRADSPNLVEVDEVLRLRRRVDELEERLRQATTIGPPGAERLSSGTDSIALGLNYDIQEQKPTKNGKLFWRAVDSAHKIVATTWDDLFAHIAPHMINGARGDDVAAKLADHLALLSNAEEGLPTGRRPRNYRLEPTDFQKVKIQLRGLGLIGVSGRGAGRWGSEDWSLTEYGDKYLMKQVAVLRPGGDK